MKRLSFFAILTALSVAASASDTAYTALRVVGKKNGDDALSRVLEVHGRLGSPDPQAWKIVLAEPSARGGVREFEVQRGKITSERAPSGRGGGAPLDLNRLNIDSDGAFTILNEEAQKASVPFDRVDYDLASSGRGTGVWHLELYNGRDGKVGSVDIAADSGNVVNKSFSRGGRSGPPDDQTFLREQNERDRHRGEPPPRYADDRRPSDDRRPYDERRLYRDEDYVGPGIFDLFGKVERHFEKRGKQLKNFFTH